MTAIHEEREAKLHAPEDFSLARLPSKLAHYTAEPAEFHRLHTIYYDTEDARLARWGCSLRFRVTEGWTLKLPDRTYDSGNAPTRNEHTFDGDVRQVPDQALELARAFLRGSRVAPVAELRTLRTKRAVRDGSNVVADIVDDDVRVVAGNQIEHRFRQLEIERGDAGDDRDLDTLRAALVREGAGPFDPLPKNVRALGGGLEPEIPTRVVKPSSRAADVFAAAFGESVSTLVRREAALNLEDDPEALHDVRTAIRRLRSYLRTFRPILDRQWAQDLREELSWVNRLLARARNLDVLLASVRERVRELEPTDAMRALPLWEHLSAERERAYADVHAGLRQPRFDALLDDVIAAARSSHFTGAGTHSACKIQRKVVRGARKRLVRAVRDAGVPPSERDLHQIRIKSKHLRFLAEAHRPIAGKRMKKLARRAERLQTILGEHHDAVVAVRHLRTLRDDAALAFVAGQLAEHLRRHGARCRLRWRKALRAL